MLRCYLTRRRLGAYVDGALTDRESALAAAHMATCARCHAEAESVRRLTGMLRRSVSNVVAPEWTGFWQGVRRGIEDARPEARRRTRPGWRPRFVVGTATAAAVVAGLILLGTPRTPFSPRPAAAISVSSADTEHPGATVMVYSPPEKDLAVVWVFNLD